MKEQKRSRSFVKSMWEVKALTDNPHVNLIGLRDSWEVTNAYLGVCPRLSFVSRDDLAMRVLIWWTVGLLMDSQFGIVKSDER